MDYMCFSAGKYKLGLKYVRNCSFLLFVDSKTDGHDYTKSPGFSVSVSDDVLLPVNKHPRCKTLVNSAYTRGL